jgi:hypothetical protein
LRANDQWEAMPRRRNQKAKETKEYIIPQQLYKGPLKIKKDKYKQLQSLKSVIPADYHQFYDNLHN